MEGEREPKPEPKSADIIDLAQRRREKRVERELPGARKLIEERKYFREGREASLEKVVADFVGKYDSAMDRIRKGLASPELARDVQVLRGYAKYIFDNATTSSADVQNRMRALEELIASKYPDGLPD